MRARKLAYVAVVNVYVIADAQLSDGDEPTTPRTVIGAGESESVPVAADSVVHKHGGRRRHLAPSRVAAPFPPSLPIRALLSLSLALTLVLCLSRPYGQPTAAGEQKRARSRPIASDVPRYPRVYKAAARAIRPHTPNHATHGHPPTSPFAPRSPSSLPSVAFVRAKDATPGYNLLPLNSRAKQCVLYVTLIFHY